MEIRRRRWYNETIRNLEQAGKGKAGAMAYYAYLLRCSDGTLYSGFTTDPRRRAEEHNRGVGAKYTRSRRPVELVYQECFSTKSEALRREAALKKLTRAEKLRLISRVPGGNAET